MTQWKELKTEILILSLMLILLGSITSIEITKTIQKEEKIISSQETWNGQYQEKGTTTGDFWHSCKIKYSNGKTGIKMSKKTCEEWL